MPRFTHTCAGYHTTVHLDYEEDGSGLAAVRTTSTAGPPDAYVPCAALLDFGRMWGTVHTIASDLSRADLMSPRER